MLKQLITFLFLTLFAVACSVSESPQKTQKSSKESQSSASDNRVIADVSSMPEPHEKSAPSTVKPSKVSPKIPKLSKDRLGKTGLKPHKIDRKKLHPGKHFKGKLGTKAPTQGEPKPGVEAPKGSVDAVVEDAAVPTPAKEAQE